MPQQVRDVGELLSKAHQEEKATNRKMLLKILQCIRFLARQGLPLRGHGGDSDGNLNQLLQLQCIDCLELSVWLRKKTDKYTSHDIQNEIMRIMAMHILRQICVNIRENGWYTLMADECTDISNREQFTICIRWVEEDLQVHEDFVGLYEMAKINADSLVGTIKDSLIRMNIQISNCQGQCYDGVSNMSGCKKGVAAQITSEENRALFVHCHAHSLNLAVADTIKQTKVCSNALEVAFEVTKLI